MITIIDYNAGNIKSIQNMLKKIGVKSTISSQANEIEQAEKLILPGVGHFDYGMRNLRQSGLIDVLNKKVMVKHTPLLGICLGAQMLGNKSEEGNEKGLSWIDMDVIKFNSRLMGANNKIPHMDWTDVNVKKQSNLFNDMFDHPRFYFVHSYHMSPKNTEDILCTSNYGYDFVSAVEHKNIYGVQFHPEKSHKFGMKLLENFAKI